MPLKPETKKAIEEAREELKHANMKTFDHVLRALARVPVNQKLKKRRH